MVLHPAAMDMLATIAQRREVLGCVLTQDGVVSKQTVFAELELPQSTVNKILRELHDVGLLERASDGVIPTLLATMAYDEYCTFSQQLAAIESPDHETPLWPTVADRQEVMGLIAARLDLLECLETTPHNKRDLVAALDVSRSTINRAIRELEIAGLVTWNTDEYTVTMAGCHAVTLYRATIATISDLLTAQDVLAALPHDGPIDPSLLAGPVVENAAEAAPYHLPEGIRDRIAAAERVRIYLPALATPLLLDCCHRSVVQDGLALAVLTSSDLFETLTTAFPGPLADMATDGACTVNVTDAVSGSLPPFGLILAETETTTTVSVIAYNEHGTIQGTIHNETADAVQWAEACYSQIRNGARDVTDTLPALAPERTASATVGEAAGNETRLAFETEGFVQLTPEYFTQRAPAPPITAWRTGFDLIDVHAGYAIDRETERDGTRHTLTTDLIDRLTEGTNIAVLGPPGSGKSTVCKTVACRWYEQGLGPVFYRESGTGTTFTESAVLENHFRETDGHALIVVEDAVRAEANAIFRVMKAFRGTESVTFLLDAREKEWVAPETFPTDAGIDAYRIETTETVTVPALDDTERERFVRQFEQTTDGDLSGMTAQVLQGNTDTDAQTQDASEPAEVLLLLHRLSLQADPLAVYTTNIPTVLTEDVQRTYAALEDAGDLVLDVGVLVNLLNAAGIDVSPALICALATDEEETDIESVRDALSVLEGRVIFERVDGADAAPYRAVHEEWSVLFLDHLLESETRHAASQRVGRCVTALLALADEPARRDRLMAAFMQTAPTIERITDAPGEWADTTVEQLFGLGRRRRGLAPLFGTTGDSQIDLPDACSQTITVNCTRWRAKMAWQAGDFDRSEHEFECLATLADDIEPTDSEWAATLRGRRLNGLGVVARNRGVLDTAEERFMCALDLFRQTNNTLQIARTRSNLGMVVCLRGDIETAEELLTQSLDTFRDCKLPRHEAVALQNLGVIIRMTGALETSIDYNKQALNIFREIGDRQSIADCFKNIGVDVMSQGNLDAATSYSTQALELYREIGTRIREARALDSLGEINRIKGDFETAETYHSRSLNILRETGDRRNEAWCLTITGTLSRKRGDLDTASEHCETSHEIYLEIDHQPGKANSLVELGQIAYERGDLDTAIEHAEESRTLYQEIGDGRGEAVSHRLLGQIACDQERFTTADDYLTQALTCFRDTGYRYEEAKTVAALGALARARTNQSQACEWFETAITLYRDIGAVRDTIETIEQLTRVCEPLGEIETAIEYCETADTLVQNTAFVEASMSFDAQRTRLAEQLASDDRT